jgi:hypothetical protein
VFLSPTRLCAYGLSHTSLDKTSLESKFTEKTWLNAPELSKAQIDPEKTFELFALKMLSKLIPAEEFITNRESGMRIFVRVDASIFLAEEETHFIVNELTRSHNTDMFNHWDEAFKNELLVQELAKVLCFVSLRDRNKCRARQ